MLHCSILADRVGRSKLGDVSTAGPNVLRLLVLIAIVAVVALIVYKLVKGIRGDPGPAASGSDEPPPAVEDTKLVRCGSCGAYVPRGEALPAPDGFRCGEARCRESVQ
jgi:hypothetical protein